VSLEDGLATVAYDPTITAPDIIAGMYHQIIAKKKIIV
jgi:hypothetical protein